MQFRIIYNKHPLKHLNSLAPLQDQPQFEFSESQNNTKFKFGTEENCCNLDNLKTVKQKRKTKVTLPPIVPHLPIETLQNLNTVELASNSMKKKKQSNLKKNHGQTQRPHYQIRKLAGSTQSTTNQSETKSLSGGQTAVHQEWDTLPIHNSSTKSGSTNMTHNEVTHDNMRHRSTEKCLIAHSKRLPFSLQKKKTHRKLSYGLYNEPKHFVEQQPFEANLSSILCKRESKQFLDEETCQELLWG